MRKRPVKRSSDGQFWFDKKEAELSCRFFEKYLRHSRGKLAGLPFKLTKWQSERIIKPLFGWKREEDGTRRYRTCYVEIPKKNGKSTTAAGVGLKLLLADGEAGPEVYSAAADKEQAGIVFNTAKEMRDTSPQLKKRTLQYKNSIVNPSVMGSYRVISAKSDTKHGFNPHGIIFDELHVQPNRELWDTLTAGVAAREQPLVFAMTTAGYDRNSICWEQHDYAEKVIAGDIKDDAFLGVIFGADEKDDWTDPKVWKKANPNLGVSVTMDYMRNACAKAKQIPAFENTFRRLHLNQWTQQASRWIQMRVWDETAGTVDLGRFEGMTCYGGLDLASTTDIAAFVLTFEIDGHYFWVPFFWIPSEKMQERVKRDRVPYDVWARQGLVKVTEGNVIDYKVIIADILKLREVFDLREVAFDRWGATKIMQDLMEEGITMVPFGQGYASMSSPTKELNNLLLGKKLHHGSNPVLRWMANNVVIRQDPAGNIKPDKSKSTSKIDGIVAGIMSLDRAIRKGEGSGPSVYEDRGLRTL